MPGLLTHAVPQTGVYIVEHPGGSRVQIGVYDPALPGAENKMRACSGLSDLAVAMLKRLEEHWSERVFIDEIGYLESSSSAYMNALRELLSQKCVIAAVRKQDTPFLLELRERSDVFCVDLDAPFGHAGCVIMASGQSKRFGSNKLTADFRGEPMIRRILSATEGVFAQRVVVTRHSEIAQLCQASGIDVILHALPHRSDTVRLGLDAVGSVEGCMFCPADQPLLRKDTIASLVLSAAHDPGSIWRPCFGDTTGSPVLFPKWTFEQLMHLPEGMGGGHVIRMHPDHVRTLSVKDAFELMDADDPSALARLLHIDSE